MFIGKERTNIEMNDFELEATTGYLHLFQTTWEFYPPHFLE